LVDNVHSVFRKTILFATVALSIAFASQASSEGFAGGLGDTLGPDFAENPRAHRPPQRPAPHGKTTEQRIRYWNQVAINATGLDHTPVAAGEDRVFGEQLGPGRSSRAMAIIHIAMFDAIDAIVGGYESYTGVDAGPGTSVDAAIAQAAHDTLVALYPSQRTAIDALLAADLDAAGSERGSARDKGIVLGRRVAAAILALRAADGSQYVEPQLGVDFVTSNQPGMWRQDPIGQSPLALGAHWGAVLPFVLEAGDQFRVPPPPAMTSARYLQAFNEAKRVGGDGVVTPTERTAEQTSIGLYWAYDGTPSLCAPPRLYNQLVMTIADRASLHPIELARLLALVNTAMADAATAVWESKYTYQFWRPVTGIREADIGTGPTGLGDENPATIADPAFTPMGAPASNLNGPNFTPPFPAYPSGHAGFGGAVFQTLRHFFGTDAIAFTFVSDELNGVTLDHAGNVRPLLPRHFSSLSQAEEENGQSRIYLGIHWEFDKTEGILQGRRVADYVWANAFQPVHLTGAGGH
jgi:PAP2 superfamily protein